MVEHAQQFVPVRLQPLEQAVEAGITGVHAEELVEACLHDTLAQRGRAFPVAGKAAVELPHPVEHRSDPFMLVRGVSVQLADIALFAERQAEGGAELLVRAKHDRAFPDGESLFTRMRAAPPDGEHEIRVDRASPRRSARGQKGFAGREARRATAQLRWQALDVPVPKRERGRLGTGPLRLTAVHVHEPEPPAGAEAVEWLLLTTLPVAGRTAAVEVLDLYALRWRIEDWHRILKSGCDVEKTAHNTAERIKRAVTLNAVIAWRLSALTLLGRATPELPAENLFAKSEIAMLLDYAHHMGFSLPCQETPGDMPELDAVSLGEAVLLVARLGGYLNRKNDGPPGHQVVWEGYARMSSGAQTLERAATIGDDSALHKLIAQKKND